MPKRIALFFALLLLVLAAGCGTTSQERIDFVAGAIARGTEVSADVDAQIAVLSEQMRVAQAELALAPPGSETAQKIAGFITDAGDKVAELQAYKTRVDQALVTWQESLEQIRASGDSLTFGDELEALGRGVSAAAGVVPGPWSAIVGLVGTGLAMVGGVIARQQKRKREASDIALEEVVTGVDQLLKTKTPTEAKAIKDVIKTTQVTPGTQAKVALIQAESKLIAA